MDTYIRTQRKNRKKMIAKVAFFLLFFHISIWKMMKNGLFVLYLSAHFAFCFILFNFHFIFSPIFSCNSPTLFSCQIQMICSTCIRRKTKNKKKNYYYYYIRGGEWQRLRRPFFFCLCSQAMYQLFFFWFFLFKY